jgi:hypothetical protein
LLIRAIHQRLFSTPEQVCLLHLNVSEFSWSAVKKLAVTGAWKQPGWAEKPCNKTIWV